MTDHTRTDQSAEIATRADKRVKAAQRTLADGTGSPAEVVTTG